MYTVGQVEHVAKHGEIILFRDGQIYRSYADGVDNAIDYGFAFSDALSNMQAYDKLYMYGFTMAGKDYTKTVSNIQIIADQVTLFVSGVPYTHGLYLTGSNNLVYGLTVDGRDIANSGASGYALRLVGDNIRVENCSCSGMRSLNDDLTSNFYFGTGNDSVLKNCVGGPGCYTSIRGFSANRLTIDGFRSINPRSRAMNFEGANIPDWIVINNSVCTQDGFSADDNIMINFNQSAYTNDVYILNSSFRHADMVSTGVSYNETPQMYLMKGQNIRRLHMHNCRFLHGRNIGAGKSTTIRYEGGANPVVKEWYISDCSFSDGFNFDVQYPDIVKIERSHFGIHNNDLGALIYNVRCKDFDAKDCTFDLHAGTGCLVSSSHSYSDSLKFRNCHFTANKATDTYVFSGPVRNSVGSNVFTDCLLNNSGAGELYLHSSEIDTLVMTTDYNGDLLYDVSISGTGPGKHPAPGSGPHHFPTVPAPSGYSNVKIWNTHWTTAGPNAPPERAYIGITGVWKDWS